MFESQYALIPSLSACEHMHGCSKQNLLYIYIYIFFIFFFIVKPFIFYINIIAMPEIIIIQYYIIYIYLKQPTLYK